MLFRQLSAKWGSEFAQIDLVLEKDEIMMGESFTGYLIIEGGMIEYEFEQIDIDYQVSLYLDEQEVICPIERMEIHQPFIIQPATKKIFPFSFKPTSNSILSWESVIHYLVVHLKVSGKQDSSERVLIKLHPHYHLRSFITALEGLGFEERSNSRRFDGYLQEFRFQPNRLFTDVIKEIRMVIVSDDKGLRILLESVLYNYLMEKEVKREILIDKDKLESMSQLKELIRESLQEMIAHPYAFSRDKYFYYQYHHKRLSQKVGAIGAWLKGKVSIDDWLAQERAKEEKTNIPKIESGDIEVEKIYATMKDEEYDELFRDVFLDDFFEEDDD
ncbi:Sporulation-control protein spo0M [Seinonella peptonophila]|uniref:Sporulation-control protein spo0M n=1 Tax=Seinonella peptonophila TaxID=112248 RepID=A0A1M4U8R6_9BACL|nr:sporulation protein [Seinonella peptonophila]SHE53016.1 Sporulation-control protein spo0M [Seinonella peptonophila]